MSSPSGSKNKLSSTIPTYTSVSRSRLHSLYSDFSPQKHSNPAGFQANVDWWRRTLLHILATATQPSSSNALILRADTSLLEALRCEELGVGKPLGIGSVITELSSSGVLISLTSFQSSTQSIYHPGSVTARVASYLVGKPLWWALAQLNIVGDNEQEEPVEKRWSRVQGDHVAVPLVEQAADAVLEHYRSQPHLSLSDSLFSVEAFRAEFASKGLPGITLSLSDVKVLIKFLERDRQSIATYKEIVKFIDPSRSDQSARIVTQVDRGVLEMKMAVSRLQDQIEDINRKIENRAANITEQLRRKRKEMALSYLKSRKQLEDLLAKRLRSLETIQSTLMQVESAAGDIEIMKAYETSTMTLKTLLAHPSLQKEKIDETMDAMAEASADHAEVEQAIRLGGDGVTAATGIMFDEDALQQELLDLADEKEKEEAEARELKALEDARKEQEQREREACLAQERKYQERRDEGEHRQKVALEGGGRLGVSEEADRQWEQRWLDAQAEKAAQAQSNRDAENKRRAKWEVQAGQAA